MKNMVGIRNILIVGLLAAVGYAGYGWKKASERAATLESELSDTKSSFGRFVRDVQDNKVISAKTYKAEKDLLTDLTGLFQKPKRPSLDDIVNRLKNYPWSACTDGPCKPNDPIGMCCDGVNYPGYVLLPGASAGPDCCTYTVVDGRGNPATCAGAILYYNACFSVVNLDVLRACNQSYRVKKTCGDGTTTYYPEQ